MGHYTQVMYNVNCYWDFDAFKHYMFCKLKGVPVIEQLLHICMVTCVYGYLYVWLHVCMVTCVYGCIYIYSYMCVWLHVCMVTCVYGYM